MQKRRKTSKKKGTEGESDEGGLPVYCVCRSSDAERFMIACDQCEEWYHGDCINVTPKQAEQIKTFYCPQCRCKNPSLEIEYKNTRNQKPKQLRQNLSPGSSVSNYIEQQSPPKSAKVKKTTLSSTSSVSTENNSRGLPADRPAHLSSRDNRKYNSGYIKASPLIDSPNDVSDALNSPSIFTRSYWPHDDQTKFSEDLNLSSPHFPPKRRSGSPRSRPCGQCRGCSRHDDCGICDFCRDRRKFGGPNKMRQKCKMRQCVGVNSSRSRNPSNSSQGIGARRRKQPVPGGAIEVHSPSRPQSYVDFDDEQFEVPIDFSPRPFPDSSAHTFIAHHSNHTVPVGSKMRRGDHRLPTTPNDLDGLAARQFGRFTLDGPLGTPTHSRNKATLSNMYPLNTGEPIDFADEDSDDDIVLPEMTHCAGPACMSPAIPGEKYCSDSCKAKHTNSRAAIRPGIAGIRPGMSSISTRETYAIPYNLGYPDHMYCRHHRVQSWHNTSSPPYRTINQPFEHFTIDQAYITEGLRHTRTHPSLHYSPMPQRQPNHTNSHSTVISTTNRLNSLDPQAHAVICDPNDTTAFIDSVASAMRRTVGHGQVNAFADELGIDLPSTHPNSVGTRMSPSPSISGVNSCYQASLSVHGENVRAPVDLHVVDGDDGLPPDVDDDEGEDDNVVPENPSHAVYGYYMMGYNSESTNGHNSRVPINNTSLNDRRLDPNSFRSNVSTRTITHRLLPSDATDGTNGIGSSYVSARTLSMGSTNVRHPNMNATPVPINPDGCLNSGAGSTGVNDLVVGVSSLPNANVASHSMSAYLSGSEEFYTINDSDDLEINWPQETVAGVNG